MLTRRQSWQTTAGIVLLCEQLKACQMEIQRDRAEFDFSAFLCYHPATCRSCHVTGHYWYVSECSGDVFRPALLLKTMQNDLCMQ